MPDPDLKFADFEARTAPTYLVVMAEVFIANDLALTIKEHAPTAHVIVTQTTAQAVQMIADHKSLVIAFLCDRPQRFDSSELAQAIAQRGGRVVLLGEEAEMVGPTNAWDVLERPFSTQTVMEHLARN